jgi:hypothetical protein
MVKCPECLILFRIDPTDARSTVQMDTDAYQVPGRMAYSADPSGTSNGPVAFNAPSSQGNEDIHKKMPGEFFIDGNRV